MMDSLFLHFTALIALAGVLATIAVRAPRRMARRAGAVAISALFIPVAYAGLADLLSRPKPVWLEWSRERVAEAAVLGSHIQEGVGIYLWLRMPETEAPRSYVLPWDRKLAQQLQEAKRKAERNRAGLRMRRPFETTRDDDEPIFYAAPQPALAAKQPPRDAPVMVPPRGAAGTGGTVD